MYYRGCRLPCIIEVVDYLVLYRQSITLYYRGSRLPCIIEAVDLHISIKKLHIERVAYVQIVHFSSNLSFKKVEKPLIYSENICLEIGHDGYKKNDADYKNAISW